MIKISQPIDARLDNWGDAWRRKHAAGSIASVEGRYRGPGRVHYDYDASPGRNGITVGVAPTARTNVDWPDALEVDGAWQSIGCAFHQTVLAGWYVRRWSEPMCLRMAWEAANEHTRRRRSDFAASLAMAKALLCEQLQSPATVRRTRLAQRIRTELGMVAGDLREAA